jgi:hypothetical protein
VAAFAEEVDEGLVEHRKQGGGESPHVHRDDLVAGEGLLGAVRAPVDRALAAGVDLGAFGDGREHAVGAGAADAAGHMAMLGKGVAQDEADHAEVRHKVARSCGPRQPLGQQAIADAPIEVVGIDHREGLADCVLGHQDRVAGAPRLGAVRRQREAGRQGIPLLEGVGDGDTPREATADGLAEGGFEVAADDEDDLAEAAADRVEHRVVDDQFATGADRLKLLQAAIAAADAGRQHHQGWLHDTSRGEKCGMRSSPCQGVVGRGSDR